MSIIDKIIAFIKKYYKVDYVTHFLAGVVLGEFTFTMVHIFNSTILNYGIATAVCLFVIFFKDVVWDKWWGKGTFEWADIILGCLGLIIVVIQWLLLLV